MAVAASMTSWRGSKRMSKDRRAVFDAVHDELHADRMQKLEQDKRYAEQLDQVPEDRFEGDQINLDLSKQERRADSFRETFQ